MPTADHFAARPADQTLHKLLDNPLDNSADKPLDQMNRLADMAHFPAAVNAGATANVLLTITVIFFLRRFLLTSPLAVYAPVTLLTTPLAFTALVLALNLAPVVVLRALDRRRSAHAARPMPTLRTMNFIHDQHRFSDWVYLAASANMAFWILTSWALFIFFRGPAALAAMLAAAFLVTFSPVLLRRRTRPSTGSSNV